MLSIPSTFVSSLWIICQSVACQRPSAVDRSSLPDWHKLPGDACTEGCHSSAALRKQRQDMNSNDKKRDMCMFYQNFQVPGKHASHWAMRLRWWTVGPRGPRPGWLMGRRWTSVMIKVHQEFAPPPAPPLPSRSGVPRRQRAAWLPSGRPPWRYRPVASSRAQEARR